MRNLLFYMNIIFIITAASVGVFILFHWISLLYRTLFAYIYKICIYKWMQPLGRDAFLCVFLCLLYAKTALTQINIYTYGQHGNEASLIQLSHSVFPFKRCWWHTHTRSCPILVMHFFLIFFSIFFLIFCLHCIVLCACVLLIFIIDHAVDHAYGFNFVFCASAIDHKAFLSNAREWMKKRK